MSEVWNRQQAVEFAVRSAAIVVDQQHCQEHATPEDCVWSYWQNVRDTLAEYGASGFEHDALNHFWNALPADLASCR